VAYEHALFASLRNDRLELRLLPTEQCNFRCTYCYETFEHKKMRPGVVAGIKALISRRAPSLTELHIDWFGGEPMLAPDIVGDICRHARAQAAAHGFAYTGGMTTNGYFLDEAGFRHCLDHGVNDIQISFDGDRALHDKSRVLGSGAGTFDRIWSNVMAMKSVKDDFAVLLRLHYTAENYRQVAEFGRKVHDTLGDDPRFRLFFKGILPLGGANDAAITRLTPKQDAEIRRLLWNESGYPLNDISVGKVCYAAMANSLVVRSTGRLAKCTVALSSDYNDIGEITEDGDIVIDQPKFQRWIAPVVEGNWAVVGCPVEWVARQAMAAKAAA